MFWTIYISQRYQSNASKHRLFIKEAPSISDRELATIVAARHFKVKRDIVLCIPTAKKEIQ